MKRYIFLFLVPLLLSCSMPVDVENKTEGERNADFIQQKVDEEAFNFKSFRIFIDGEIVNAFDDYVIQGEYLIDTYTDERVYYNLNKVIAIEKEINGQPPNRTVYINLILGG